MRNWLIDRIVAHARRRPYRHLPGYMERYWMFRTPWLSCRLHVILASDDDRALHDHPFPWCSIILRGGYFEITQAGRRWCGRGSVRARRATTLHRLELPHRGTTCLTLFFMGPRWREWGFQTPHGWVSSRDYVKRIHRGEIPGHWRTDVQPEVL